MRIEQLYYLIEISRQHSLNLAAETLHVSVQALSSSIKNLETELHTTILNRTNRGVSLTEAGQQVLQYAHTTVTGYENLLASLSTAEQAVDPNHATLKGNLFFYTMPAFLETFLPAKIEEFQQRYPEVRLQISQNTTYHICNAILNHTQPAFGLLMLPCNKNGLLHSTLPEGPFSFRPISINRYVCCVPKDSPFARHKTISIKKILKEPLVIYTTGTVEDSTLYQLLTQYSQQLRIGSRTASIHFWAKAIEKHTGIGFLNELFISPNSMVKDVFEDLIFIKIKEPLLSINGFLYTDDSLPLANAFMEQFPTFRPSKNDPDFCTECMVL